MTICPCGSGNSFANCCEPIIRNQSAATALLLMKSRYVAYCIGNVEYLCNTVVVQNRKQYNREEIAQWSSENKWQKLEILSYDKGGINDTVGTVEFKAYYINAHGREQVHYEKSSFCKENGSWYYIDGQFSQAKPAVSSKLSRNSPCLCGSGKKYKNCCQKT